jgi:hypothetical protein
LQDLRARGAKKRPALFSHEKKEKERRYKSGGAIHAIAQRETGDKKPGDKKPGT